MKIGANPSVAMTAKKPTKQQELDKAKDIFSKLDLASVLGDCTAKATGKVTFKTTKNPDVVVAEGKGKYDDLWGGAGDGQFKLEINIKTGKATGSWE